MRRKREKEEGDGDDSTDRRLPQLVEGQDLNLEELTPKQHFTQPPPRFSEATLVKELEENGIGRPSTYASIWPRSWIGTTSRRRSERFRPTELGLLVNELMVASFGRIVDVGYTARMEEELDRIEEGELNWIDALRRVPAALSRRTLETARVEMRDVKREDDPDRPDLREVRPARWCSSGAASASSSPARPTRSARTRARSTGLRTPTQDDGRSLVDAGRGQEGGQGQGRAQSDRDRGRPVREVRPVRWCCGAAVTASSSPARAIPSARRHARSWSRRTARPRPGPTCCSMKPARAATQKLAIKQGRYGEFTACSSYPKCRYVKMKETDVVCPECGKAKVVERRSKRGKLFYGCGAYPDCSFVTWKRPIEKACPECESPFLVEKITKKHGRQLMCDAENCDYIESSEA